MKKIMKKIYKFWRFKKLVVSECISGTDPRRGRTPNFTSNSFNALAQIQKSELSDNVEHLLDSKISRINPGTFSFLN